jgi:hypothetical protein
MERREAHTGFWWGDVREEDHVEDPDVDRGYRNGSSRSGMGGVDWIDVSG